MDEAAQPQPIPKRYWWLKRLSAGAACLLGALILLRLWWGYEANRRLAAEIRRWQAAGQPVFAAEFDAIADAVPDEDNAALLYEEAIGLIVPTSAGGIYFSQYADEPEAVKGRVGDAQELLRLNTPALQRVRQARIRPAVAWSNRLKNSVASVPMTTFSDQRTMAKLLFFAAMQRFEVGNHGEAVETATDFLAYNDAVGAQPVLLSSLVAWACHQLNFRFIETIGPTLRVRDGSGAAAMESGAATREQVMHLIDRLLREDGCREALARAFRGERALRIAFREDGLSSMTVWDRISTGAVRPVMVLDTLREFRLDTLAEQATMDANRQDAMKRIPALEPSRSSLRALTRPYTVSHFGGSQLIARQSLDGLYQHVAQRRMAATALAIRLYELDDGKRPTALSDLVPDYLPAVPVDPYSPSGATIRYRSGDGHETRAMLYSVGRDGTNNDGVIQKRYEGMIDWERSDIPFELSAEPRGGDGDAPQRYGDEDSEETGDNDGDADHDRRQTDHR